MQNCGVFVTIKSLCYLVCLLSILFRLIYSKAQLLFDKLEDWRTGEGPLFRQLEKDPRCARPALSIELPLPQPFLTYFETRLFICLLCKCSITELRPQLSS